VSEKSLVPLTDQMAARIALVEVAIGKTQTDKRTAKAAVIDFFHPGTGRYIRPPMSVRKLSAAGSLIPSRQLGQKGTQGAADQPYQRRGDERKDSENWSALRPGGEEIGDGKNHHERTALALAFAGLAVLVLLRLPGSLLGMRPLAAGIAFVLATLGPCGTRAAEARSARQ